MVLKNQADREYECRCIVDKMNENRSFMLDDDIRIVFEQMRRYIHEKTNQKIKIYGKSNKIIECELNNESDNLFTINIFDR